MAVDQNVSRDDMTEQYYGDLGHWSVTHHLALARNFRAADKITIFSTFLWALSRPSYTWMGDMMPVFLTQAHRRIPYLSNAQWILANEMIFAPEDSRYRIATSHALY